MMKRYFKQTWQLLRQNKTFSTLYLAGTAIPVALTMVVVMYYHIRISPVYPELHRDNLYELKSVGNFFPNGGMRGGACSLQMIREWFYPLQSAEAVTAIYYYRLPPYAIQLPDGESSLKCSISDLSTEDRLRKPISRVAGAVPYWQLPPHAACSVRSRLQAVILR